jgi:spore coat polysaccharide biosynthesis protein SpsF
VRPVVAIVQARMGSTRLPGKVLMEVCGRPLLVHQLERVTRASSLDSVWVATSDLARDDVVVPVAEGFGVPVFRGSEEDLLSRLCGAAAAADAATVVRLTADCPLIAPEVIDRVVEDFARGGADMVTNAPPQGRTYPDGMDVEVVARALLDRLDATVDGGEDREHPMGALHRGDFVVRVVHHERPLGDVRITVDTREDFELAARALAALGDRYALDDVLAWLGR